MALSRHATNTSNLLGNRFNTGRENADTLLGKAGLGKPRVNSAAQRSALGNISNKASTGALDSKKALKDNNGKAGSLKGKIGGKGVTTRSALRVINEKENGTVPSVKQEQDLKKSPMKAPTSPAPMDTSANSQGEEAFSKQLLKVTDIDKDDMDNPQLVAEYVNDIYDYMRHLETAMPIGQRYLDGTELNGRMRGILVDWLVQVHLRFHLLQETLYLTVDIIDRFLMVQEVSKSKLQLVGVTAMLLASKYEEMYAPEINDFVYITDNAYTKSDIRKMECMILKSLDFNLGRPLPLHFLRRNSKAGEVDANKHTLAKYLMELTIVDYDMVHYTPSQIAAAALCLAIKMLDKEEWSDTLTFYSHYPEKAILPIMQRMAYLVQRSGTGKLTAIKTKYQSSKFMRISTIPELSCPLIAELAEKATAQQQH